MKRRASFSARIIRLIEPDRFGIGLGQMLVWRWFVYCLHGCLGLMDTDSGRIMGCAESYTYYYIGLTINQLRKVLFEKVKRCHQAVHLRHTDNCFWCCRSLFRKHKVILTLSNADVLKLSILLIGFRSWFMACSMPTALRARREDLGQFFRTGRLAHLS